MQHRHGAAFTNPMIGIYFGIFAACLGAIVVLLLIFEQMGVTEGSLRAAMAFGAMGLFAAVGGGAYTSRMRDFASAGRRVPAFYNGLTITVATFGGAGLAGIAGAMFLSGFDMLFLGLGLVAGLTVMVMLVAPYLRKLGAPTLPAFLGMRFESAPVRLLAASIAVVPLMLLLIAEIKIAALGVTWLTGLGPAAAVTFVVAVLVATVAPGGVRSLSWSSAAQALAMLLAVFVPVMIAAVIETNLPIAPLTHGPILRAVGRAEAVQEVPIAIAGLLTLEVPHQGMQAIAGRFTTVFGTVGPLAFVLGTLSVMAGIAGSPALLGRAMTTPTVYDTRKSVAWAVVLVGILITTFSAVAVFERNILMTEIAGQSTSSPPEVVRALVNLGLATMDTRTPTLTASSLLMDRDATLVALPVMIGLPGVVVSLAAAGLLAAALAGAAASLVQLGLILGEDVVNAPESWRMSDLHRLMTCRLAIAGIAVLGGGIALLASGDPLALMLHALAISGSALFPILVLSIWWKRINAPGAAAGLGAGFIVALLMIAANGIAGLGLAAALAPAIAMPVAIAVAVVISHLTPAPGRHILESVRDLRVPGGETVYDRELRQARQRNPQSL